MRDARQKCSIVFFIFTILLVSGCVSPSTSPEIPLSLTPANSGIPDSQPAAELTYQYPPDPSHWIEVDPIKNFTILSGSGADRIVFNITGTTNLPVNSLLFVEPYRNNPSLGKEETALFANVVVPVENKGGISNTFFYAVNVSADKGGFPIKPGEYRIVVRRWNVTNSTGFTILGKDPLPWIWIRIDPVGEHHVGDIFNITGTTNLPAGLDINGRFGAEIHSCPTFQTLPSGFSGSLCGHDCIPGDFSNNKIPIIQGDGGINTWNFSVNTTDWCFKERYSVTVQKNEWDNNSPASQDFRFQSG